METLSVNSYSCYGCGITDRDRLYILFLEQWIKKDKFYKILEFAPRQSLSNYIKNLPNVEHRTTDLFMKNVDDNLDIQNLHSYKNNNFDLVICSHVLEHVQNDKQAMSELYRILKPEGVGIVMVPLVIGNNAMIEDESITDSCLRIKYFGQADHVRLYSKKIFLERLQSVGFEVMQYNQSCFDSKEWSNAGLSSSSILYVVKKR
ncbi:MAG: class I SAM-dependent methyltransferase [Ferruginibacter sp.]|nr:class I SAM-dependent methyltransferase [Ferruginibacter sp.]